MADADMDGSSSDEMSDFEDIEISDADMATMAELEQALQENANLYDKHLEYIGLLGKAKMKTKLRAARQAMHARFPLSPDLWLKWLDDEETSKADSGFIEELFKLATEDYLSVDIWEKYIRFLVSKNDGTAEGLAKLKDVCEAAVNVAGLHLSEGHKLWNIYREAQQAISNTEKPEEDDILFRQLQIPLAHNAGALAEMKSKGLDFRPSDAVQKKIKQAASMLEAREMLEESVSGNKTADTNLLAAYMAYVNLEEASKEPARAVCLYERTLVRFPLTHFVWQKYAQYLEQHTKDHSAIQKVYARAVRNCPWVSQLWARYLRALERGGASEKDHSELYNQALSSGLESPQDYMAIGLARLDFLRRASKENFTELFETFSAINTFIQTYFPDYVDRTFRLPSYWAMCLWELVGDHENAKQVWETALDSKLNLNADAVLAYIDFEVSSKHFKEARSIFRKYHRKNMHGRGNLAIAHAWIRFERERGTAEDLLQAIIKTEPVFSEASTHDTERSHPHLVPQEAVAKIEKKKLSKEEQRLLRQEKDPNFKDKNQPKAKRQKKGSQVKPENTAESVKNEEPSVQMKDEIGPSASSSLQQNSTNGAKERGNSGKRKTGLGFTENDSKRAKTDSLASPSATLSNFSSAGQQELTSSEFPKSEPVIEESKNEHLRTDAAFQAKSETPGVVIKFEENAQNPSVKDGTKPLDLSTPSEAVALNKFRRKAFIKSIASESTKEDIRNLVETFGRVIDVTMPMNTRTNRHKGFAYVTFAEPDALHAVLSLHGTNLHGHELQVRPASQEVHEDARTAFVLDLPNTANEDSLRTLFSLCGNIQSIRLPLVHETSQPRGFAYVEFETRDGLQNAVDMTGVELDGRSLQIKIADIRGGVPGGGYQGGYQGGRGNFAGGRGGGRRGRGPGGLGQSNGGRGFDPQIRERAGPDEPPGGGGRAVRHGLDLDGNTPLPPRPQIANGGAPKPKSNADFRALLR